MTVRGQKGTEGGITSKATFEQPHVQPFLSISSPRHLATYTDNPQPSILSTLNFNPTTSSSSSSSSSSSTSTSILDPQASTSHRQLLISYSLPFQTPTSQLNSCTNRPPPPTSTLSGPPPPSPGYQTNPPKMCTQTITQSLCSHCKELLLEITTEERCPKVIQAQAYTFSCGTKKTTTRAKEYPRKCNNCIKKEQQILQMQLQVQGQGQATQGGRPNLLAQRGRPGEFISLPISSIAQVVWGTG